MEGKLAKFAFFAAKKIFAMSPLFAFFRLIRWRNLVIVAIAQWFIWRYALVPMAAWSAGPLFLDGPKFLVLMLSTLSITAGGYIINDYFDVKIDLLNKPDKVVIERSVSRRTAMLWHSLCNLIGLAGAFYLARGIGREWLVGLQAGTTLLLWLYSTTFKRRFMSGNVIVALLTALSIGILVPYEPALYPYVRFVYFLPVDGRWVLNPFWVLAVYCYFAFMLTWMREVVKDMEDFKGDAENGCVTMPIKIGLRSSARFVAFLGVLAIVPLCLAAFRLYQGPGRVLATYILLALVLPLCLWIGFLLREARSAHYARASKLLKGIMLLGIFSILLCFWMQYA